jgi:hypothetical protein
VLHKLTSNIRAFPEKMCFLKENPENKILPHSKQMKMTALLLTLGNSSPLSASARDRLIRPATVRVSLGLGRED